MSFYRFKQAFVGSCLLLSVSLPMYASQEKNDDYAAVIHFSNNDDAKRLVHTSYSTLLDLNKTFQNLFIPVINSLSTGNYNEDQKFQYKKLKLSKSLNKQKFELHLFNYQEINISIRDDGRNNQYEIQIPPLDIFDLGLLDSNLLTTKDAEEAEIVISSASIKIKALLTPQVSNTEGRLNDSATQKTFIHTLKIKNPNSAREILNSLERLNDNYEEQFNKMKMLAHEAASGKHSPKELKYLSSEFTNLKFQLGANLTNTATIQFHKLFDDNQLIINFKEKAYQYYLPKLSLSILQLDNDSINDIDSALKTYGDLSIATNWMAEWLITGQEAFQPAPQGTIFPLPSFAVKKDKA